MTRRNDGEEYYYAMASFHPIELEEKLEEPDKYDYRSLGLGKQRTGCLTAWKRLLYCQYGMETGQNKKDYKYVNPSLIEAPFKDAYIEMVEQKRIDVPFTAPGNFANGFKEYLQKFVPDPARDVNIIPLFCIYDSAHEAGTMGIAHTEKDAANNYWAYCFVFWKRHEGDEKELAHTAVHELMHGFLQRQSDYYGFGKGHTDPGDGTKDGHDLHKGWDGKEDCIMRWKNGGHKFCLKHLEALRRQRYDFFRRWLQEKDKRK